jgi:hypothetical protein
MAWEPFEQGPIQGFSGDFPLNEIRSVLSRIRREYLERFGRNPFFAELLYTLYQVVAAQPSLTTEDEQIPQLQTFFASLTWPTSSMLIDPSEYQGFLDEEGTYFTVRSQQGASRLGPPGEPVLRVEVVDVVDKEILCRYTPLSPTILDVVAKCLIRQCVLSDMLDYDLTDPDLKVLFERV